MPVTHSINRFNYEALLPHFRQAHEITIVTYSLETNRSGPLKDALNSLRHDARLTLITCIPSCAMNFLRSEDANSTRQIIAYYQRLDPVNFRCPTESYLCHHNHAKVIRVDDRAYVGSANFTTGSSQNYEAGYLTEAPADLRQLDAFIEKIKARAIPYFRVAGSLPIQRLLQFAADGAWLDEEMVEHAYSEHEVYKEVFERRFELAGFSLPETVRDALYAAEKSVNALKAKAGAEDVQTKSEAILLEAGWTDSFCELLEMARAIESKERLPATIDFADAAEQLYGKYYRSENPADNPALQAEAEEMVEANKRQQSAVAEKEMAEFRKKLATVTTEIMAVLSAR